MMKHMKRIASLLMALVMAAALMVPAMAAGEGKITITNAGDNVTYKLYKLLDLESYDKGTLDQQTGKYEDGAYSYKVNSAWGDFFKTGAGKDYMDVTADGYATWKGDDGEERVAAFAEIALDYAEKNNMSVVQEYTNTDSSVTAFEFDDLDLGYYLLDSSLGALCRLTTTNPTAEIQDKNAKPTIDKDVKDGDNWRDENTAKVGDILEFRVTINACDGAENYVLHDMMTGMTFTSVTKVEHKPKVGDAKTLTEKTEYFVETGVDQNEDCEFEKEDHCTFRVTFDQSFCDTLEDEDEVIIYYGATVNTDAVVNEENITNQAMLQYGEKHYVLVSGTTTKSFGFDLVKTDKARKLLDGAQFKIYDAKTGGNEVAVVKTSDGPYRPALTGETGVSIVVEGGIVRVRGLDAGTYYLEETVAPAGYNKLTERHKVEISTDNLYAVVTEDVVSDKEGETGVLVINQTGSLLPETGGIGTTIFYVLGGVLVLGAGVALVTKKRMV